MNLIDELREKLRYTNQWPAQGTSERPPDPPRCTLYPEPAVYPQAVPGRTAASLAEENAALRALVRVLLDAKP